MTQLAFWKTFITPNRYSHDQIPDLTGKVAIVTGANTGLGYATTVALAAHGAHVFLACRNKQRAEDAITRATAEIKETYPHASEPKLEFLELDLNDMTKSRQAAQEFLKKGLPLHILINNSGIMMCPFALSADGIETQFAVNHMGHFVFTLGLLDKLKESQPSRIVVLSSIGHESPAGLGGIDFDTLNDPTKTNARTRYGRSKLANILFTKALARRLANERVYVNAAHPGYVSTELIRHTGDEFGSLMGTVTEKVTRMVAMSPKVGALTELYVATSPEIENNDVRGRYFIPIANEIQPSALARDEELQEKLWTFSEKLMNEKVKV
ncbi:hypothetical protein BGZ97_002558 [Linnemannia gamsii]|uniref:NAD(P)-binding protein n=1 Tax=Linnemannia gamsii TaxID=64522 RepID=A0A9P6USR6_9FUNG|nr:hypothetical protein BGZ97_002558 [Linnemannia gamsii]